jgi:hypothetical protein
MREEKIFGKIVMGILKNLLVWVYFIVDYYDMIIEEFNTKFIIK